MRNYIRRYIGEKERIPKDNCTYLAGNGSGSINTYHYQLCRWGTNTDTGTNTNTNTNAGTDGAGANANANGTGGAYY